VTKSLVILVHGFRSSPKTWKALVKKLRKDSNLSGFDFDDTFEYSSKLTNFNPLRRIPRLREVGEDLGSHLSLPKHKSYEKVILIGHSLGGLVIQSYLATQMEDRKGEDLRRVHHVILIATPNFGSTIGSVFRRLVSYISASPQERVLRAMNEEISDLRKKIQKNIVDAPGYSATQAPIPVVACWGMNDKVVLEASAKGDFEECVPLDGDHFGVLDPKLSVDNYSKLTKAIMEPPGHKAFFQLVHYGMDLKVEPRIPPQEIVCEHGTTKRNVTTDNVAHLSRIAEFSPQNRRTEAFAMGYGTRRPDGYVFGQGNVKNEAHSDDKGAWEDHGIKCVFEFKPKAGQTYTFDADIYKGFNAGSRDIHFHLKPDRQYQKITVGLDLSAYVKAGWLVSKEPLLFHHPFDPGSCGEVCKQRVRQNGKASQATGASGSYQWELNNIMDGVIDVVWDVAEPAPKVEVAGHGQ